MPINKLVARGRGSQCNGVFLKNLKVSVGSGPLYKGGGLKTDAGEPKINPKITNPQERSLLGGSISG